MHLANFPFMGDLQDLQKLDLTEARNIEVITSDDIKLRGYHLLPSGEPAIHASGFSMESEEREHLFDLQLMEASRIIVFFHGTGMTRAFRHRLHIIRKMAAHLDFHVISFDYRGFGDSEGSPSEWGTAQDARAVLEWIQTKLTLAEQHIPIYLYGQSLGTGVAAELAANSQMHISGLILDAPFSDLRSAALTHPVGAPFRLIPWVTQYIFKHFQIRYDTTEVIGRVRGPILLMHGMDDWKVLPSNAVRVFRAAVGMDVTDAPIGSAAADASSSSRREGGVGEQLPTRFKSRDERVLLAFLPKTGHENVYQSPFWLSEMAAFIDRCEDTGPGTIATYAEDLDMPHITTWYAWFQRVTLTLALIDP